MADDVTLPGSDTTFVARANDKGGKLIQVVNIDVGADGVESIVGPTVSMPVALDTASLAALETVSVTGVSTAANQATEIAALATIGTRAYGAGQQVAVAATSAATTGLTATEVLVHSSVRCFIRVNAAATAAAGIPLEIGEKFHLRLTSGQQVNVIRDTADGFLNVVPVV